MHTRLFKQTYTCIPCLRSIHSTLKDGIGFCCKHVHIHTRSCHACRSFQVHECIHTYTHTYIHTYKPELTWTSLIISCILGSVCNVFISSLRIMHVFRVYMPHVCSCTCMFVCANTNLACVLCIHARLHVCACTCMLVCVNTNLVCVCVLMACCNLGFDGHVLISWLWKLCVCTYVFMYVCMCLVYTFLCTCMHLRIHASMPFICQFFRTCFDTSANFRHTHVYATKTHFSRVCFNSWNFVSLHHHAVHAQY